MDKHNKTIQDHYYEPDYVNFTARGKFPTKLLLGYEGEVECESNDYNTQTEEIINQYEFLYAKHDDSIENGCEINTMPFNMNWYLKNKTINYFDDVKARGFVARRNCGFHIHLSRNYFTDAHLVKMIKLFYGHPRFIQRVSQRTEDGLTWGTPYIKNELEGYFDYDDQINVNFNKMGHCRKAKIFLEDHDMKEVAINLLHENTIEIRIFQGTINKKLVMAYLEFCVAATLYTKTPPFGKISDKGFRAYVRKNRKTYKFLHNSNLIYGKVKKSYDWKKAA
jgi:hypothetical protein